MLYYYVLSGYMHYSSLHPSELWPFQIWYVLYYNHFKNNIWTLTFAWTIVNIFCVKYSRRYDNDSN